MVAWGFFGVRKKSEFEQDLTMHPLKIIAAALVALMIFIAVLLVMVRWAVS